MAGDEPPEDEPLDDLHRFETHDEAFQYVRYVGTQKDADIDLGEAALALGLLFLPGVKPDRYRHHLRKLTTQLRAEMKAKPRMNAQDTLGLRIAALRKVVHGDNSYEGDEKTYDDIQNANLIRVIERRKGLPIALGILYIVATAPLGWQMDGLNFPGHFLVRLEKDGERVILDPFRGGKEMDAAELRKLLKSIAGKGAELSHNFYLPVSRRDMLVRLENNLKKRLIEAEDYAQAVVVAEAMEALAPEEYRILFDKAVLYAKLGQNRQAATALEHYIERTPSARDKSEARRLLRQIRAEPDT